MLSLSKKKKSYGEKFNLFQGYKLLWRCMTNYKSQNLTELRNFFTQSRACGVPERINLIWIRKYLRRYFSDTW